MGNNAVAQSDKGPMKTDDPFDNYLTETLRANAKSTEQLSDESLALFDVGNGCGDALPLRGEGREANRSILLAGLAIAACLLLGLFLLPKVTRTAPIIQVAVVHVDLQVYRDAGGKEAAEKALVQFIEERQASLQHLYKKEAKHLPRKIEWKASYDVRETQGQGVDVEVVVAATDGNPHLFRLRRQYPNLAAFKDGIITLEIEMISMLLDDSRELK